jgi:predicted rRNA methylase YqxC with S4 and FtsJ domains
LLIGRPQFIAGLNNLEKAGVITKYKEKNNAVLYKVNENPENYK